MRPASGPAGRSAGMSASRPGSGRRPAPRRAVPDDLAAPHVPLAGEPGTVVRVADGAVLTQEATDSAGIRRRAVQPPVERYGARRQLDPRQVQAARRLYADYAFGLCGARDREAGSGARFGSMGLAAARVEAVTRYRRALAAAGRDGVVVDRVACGEQAAGAAAPGFGLTTAQAMTALRRGLDAVAGYYDI